MKLKYESTLDFINPSKIVVRERERKVFDQKEMQELEDAIRDHGLLQPLLLMDDNGTMVLLAGERRLRCCLKLQLNPIPVHIYPKLPHDYDPFILELFENMHRVDLTFEEESRLIVKVHNSMQKQYGKPSRSGGGRAGGEQTVSGWSMKNTAELLRKDPADITKSIQIAKAITVMPELAKAKNKNEAVKAIKKVVEKAETASLAQRHEETLSEGKTDQDDINTQKLKRLVNSYLVGDVFTQLADLPSATYKFIEIDPPYNVDLTDSTETDADGLDKLMGNNKTSEDEYEEFMLNLFKECYAKLAPGGWLLCWYAISKYHSQFYSWLTDAKFKVAPTPGFWVKTIAKPHQADLILTCVTESFFYARKGDAKLNKPHNNVFNVKSVSNDKRSHETEKPIVLYEELLNVFTRPNDFCLTPFAGSGNLMLACANLGRFCIGVDARRECKDSFVVRTTEQGYGKYTN